MNRQINWVVADEGGRIVSGHRWHWAAALAAFFTPGGYVLRGGL